ncbi:MAG: RNA pseudouridine synthase [Myxococcales bacterium]|nr:RNA pseudouridine synthase [Myxococcales bacterium]
MQDLAALCTPLFEDPRWLVVNKAPGVVVIPARNEPVEAALHQALQSARGEKLWVVHRIDRDTSGVVVFARTAEAHRHLNGLLEARKVTKRYLAFTRGAPAMPDGGTRIHYALHTARKGKMRPAHKGEADSIEALTDFAVEATWATPLGPVCRVAALPRTGRQHQIRVHFRAIECPLLVDPLYGGASSRSAAELGREGDLLLSRLSLHAASFGFTDEDGAARHFEAPLAADLAALEACLGQAPRR